jgi:hypothetical protein
MSSQSSAQLAQQNLQFAKALSYGQAHPELIGVPGSGAISQAEYDQAMAYQAELNKANQPTTPTQQPTSTTPVISPAQGIINPLPANPENPVVIQDTSGTWAIKGSTVTPTPTGIEVTAPQPKQPQPEMIEPNLQNTVSNPLGVAGTILNIASLANESQPKGPVKDFVSFGIGASGQIVNEGTQVENLAGSLTGAEPKVLPFTPRNDMEKTGATAAIIGQAVEVAVVAPAIAPALGLGAGGILVGEAIGIGLNEVPNISKTVQGQPVDLGDVITAGAIGAAEGGVFGLIGGKAINVLGVGGSGVVKAVGRVGVNTGIGALAGDVYERITTGKDTGQGLSQGALFGFVFGVGGEVLGNVGGRLNSKYDVTSRVQQKVPVPKFGDVTIPLENGKVVNYKGFYLSRGSEATKLFGRTTEVPEGTSIAQQYVPKSNIEATVTQDVMKRAGYSPETLQAVNDVRQVMRTTQNIRPKTISDVFPEKTNTLSVEGTNTVKEMILENKGKVDMVYGSYATKPQLSTKFEYMKDNVSALRTPGDIDIQLNTNQQGAEEFTSNLVLKLQAKGEPVRISQERSTLIETDVGNGKFAHSVDIHFKGEQSTDVTNPVTDKAWGFTFSKPSVKIEQLPAMALNEQGLRKGASIMGFKEDQSLGPKSYRTKDMPDFFQAQRTLLESKSGKSASSFEALNRAAEYYGVKDTLLEQPETFQYIMRQNNSQNIILTPSQTILNQSPTKNVSPKLYNKVSVPTSPSQLGYENYNYNYKPSSRSPLRAYNLPTRTNYPSAKLPDYLSAPSPVNLPSNPLTSPSPSYPSNATHSPPSLPLPTYLPEDYPSQSPPYSPPSSPVLSTKLMWPNGGQFNPFGPDVPVRGRKSFYNFGITEYPVVTAEEILGGAKKRRH